jgi:exoribonuclease R
MVHSRAKLAYEHVDPADLSDEVNELARRVAAAEEARGASRIEFPEQELVTDPTSPAGVRLAPRPRRPSEDTNSYLSLAANLAVAEVFVRHRTGLFRVMDEPSRNEVRALRKVAAAYGIDWPSSLTLRQLNARLDDADPFHVAFLLAARRSGGGATYAPFDPDRAPWHSAIAAAYSHATAPMRRLADRYVLDAIVAMMSGDATDGGVFDRLPEVMERAETVAGKVDRATIDLVESVELADRVGEVFEACVLEPGEASVVQLANPMVRARVPLGATEPGQQVRLRLTSADPTQWALRFERA